MSGTVDPDLCPKCGAEMETGFLIDRLGLSHGGGPDSGPPLVWAPIEQARMSTRIGQEGQYEVDAMRCTNCGFLELYAGLG